MEDQRAWFSEAAQRRVTTTEIGERLGVSRKTAQNRLDAGLSADDIITIARAVKISPVSALTELGKLEYSEVFDLLDGDGKMLGTASEGELAIELAQRLNTISQLRAALTVPNPGYELDDAELVTALSQDDLELAAPLEQHEDDETTDHDFIP